MAPLVDICHLTSPEVKAKEGTKRPAESTTEITPSPKRQRSKKSVRFLADSTDPSRVATTTKVFLYSYKKSDVWWTKPQWNAFQQQRMTDLYHSNPFARSVAKVWRHCQAPKQDDSLEELVLKVSQSPLRGLEKAVLTEPILSHRFASRRQLIRLQKELDAKNILRANDKVVKGGPSREDLLAVTYRGMSQGAVLFARTVAQADARVAKEYCQGGN